MSDLNGYDPRIAEKFIKLSIILSGMIGLLGCLAIIGWIYEIQIFKSVLPNTIPMKANTAFGFILISVSLLLQIYKPPSPSWRTIIAKLLALVVILIGLLTFIEIVWNLNLHIDQLLLQQLSDNDFYYSKGKMAPLSSLAFIFAGTAIFLIDLKFTVVVRQLLAYLIGIIGFFAITAISYHFNVSYTIMPFAQTALQTAVNFIFIALALFFMRPNEGVMKIIASDTIGGSHARRLLPIIFIVPAAVGYLKLFGEYYHLYDIESGIAIYACITLTFLMPIIIITFKQLMEADLLSKRKEAELKNNIEEIRDLYNFAPCGYHSINGDCVFVRVNQTELNWLGYTKEEMIGKMKLTDILRPQRIEEFTIAFEQLKNGSEIKNIETEFVRKDGSNIDVILNASPIRDEAGNFIMSRTTTADITELKLAKDKLNAALKVSESSNQDLQQFANIASHDLQEPLRTIASFIQLLERNNKDKLDKNSTEYMDFILDATARMQALIDDLLSFARITTRAKPLIMIDSNQVLQNVLNLLQAQINKRQAVITADRLPIIYCDESQLYQVFQNLISNSLKFCETTPAIHISAAEGKNTWTFAVKDNGIGIANEQISQLFTSIRRLNPISKYPGTGIGLTICKKIVERHGGKIWAESEPGRGSIFYFTMPKLMPAKHTSHDNSEKDLS